MRFTDPNGHALGWRSGNTWSMVSEPPLGDTVEWMRPTKVKDLKIGGGPFYLKSTDRVAKHLARKTRITPVGRSLEKVVSATDIVIGVFDGSANIVSYLVSEYHWTYVPVNEADVITERYRPA